MNEFGDSNDALKDAIVAAVQERGGISFRDFMGIALYYPGLGYYTSRREKIGRSGDYLTSPDTTPVFGALVGRQLREMWDKLGNPADFFVLETGAGTGKLCRDILRWARFNAPDFAGAIRYKIVEVSPALADRQREMLGHEGLADRVDWLGGMPAAIPGCILSNELLDAMPVHRVRIEDGHMHEAYVIWDGADLFEELRHPATAYLEDYFDVLGLRPGEGSYAEVNLDAPGWMAQAARSLTRGFLLTFDYGYEAAELYAAWRTDGTLMCFYRHNPSHDPYTRIGQQDITSHVDFTTVRRAGEEAGLQTVGLVTQSDFLSNLGVAEALGPPAGTDLEEYFARRRAVTDLIDPAGLGRIKVLVQSRDLGEVRLTGIHGRAD